MKRSQSPFPDQSPDFIQQDPGEEYHDDEADDRPDNQKRRAVAGERLQRPDKVRLEEKGIHMEQVGADAGYGNPVDGTAVFHLDFRKSQYEKER